MFALEDTLDLGLPLRTAAQSGAAFVSHALREDFRVELHRQVAAGLFERLPVEVGPYRVRQQAELLRIRDDNIDAYPAVKQLRAELVTLVRRDGGEIAGMEHWNPNDVAVQRYWPGSIGVSPHRDGKRNRYLIAIFTTIGSAPFALCQDRDGHVVEEWITVPGSLILMRASGLQDAEDNRPFHTVGGPITDLRFSLTFRMDSRLDSARRGS